MNGQKFERTCLALNSISRMSNLFHILPVPFLHKFPTCSIEHIDRCVNHFTFYFYLAVFLHIFATGLFVSTIVLYWLLLGQLFFLSSSFSLNSDVFFSFGCLNTYVLHFVFFFHRYALHVPSFFFYFRTMTTLDACTLSQMN